MESNAVGLNSAKGSKSTNVAGGGGTPIGRTSQPDSDPKVTKVSSDPAAAVSSSDVSEHQLLEETHVDLVNRGGVSNTGVETPNSSH